jgi:hypothetical protein
VGRIGRNQMSGIVIRPRNHAHRFTYLARPIASKSSVRQRPHTLKPNDRPSKPPTENNPYRRESKHTKSTLLVSAGSRSFVIVEIWFHARRFACFTRIFVSTSSGWGKVYIVGQGRIESKSFARTSKGKNLERLLDPQTTMMPLQTL